MTEPSNKDVTSVNICGRREVLNQPIPRHQNRGSLVALLHHLWATLYTNRSIDLVYLPRFSTNTRSCWTMDRAVLTRVETPHTHWPSWVSCFRTCSRPLSVCRERPSPCVPGDTAVEHKPLAPDFKSRCFIFRFASSFTEVAIKQHRFTFWKVPTNTRRHNIILMRRYASFISSWITCPPIRNSFITFLDYSVTPIHSASSRQISSTVLI